MTRVLNIQNSCAWPKKGAASLRLPRRATVESAFSVRNLSTRLSGKAGIGATSAIFFLALGVVCSGAFYLYQVNSLATKGFELREVEKQIQEAQKEGNKLRIQEVELKSMYNIEKATEGMNLVKPSSVSYVDMAGPVAMR